MDRPVPAGAVTAVVVPLRARQRLPRHLLALVVLAAVALVVVALLRGALDYSVTPTELLAKASPVGQDVRVEGMVVNLVDGSQRFRLTDGTTTLPVVAAGTVPTMFQAGRQVVLQGRLDAQGVFHAQRALVKHGNAYQGSDTAPAGSPG